MIIILKNPQDIYEKSNQLSDKINLETLLFTNALKSNSEKVFWTCLDWFQENKIHIFDPITKQNLMCNYKNIDKIDNIVLFKHMGSVEGQIEKIKSIFKNLETNSNLRIINNTNVFLYGFDKKYLLELKKTGFPVIPTKLYSNKTSFNELDNEYKILSNYLIKPTTGELSNSVKLLSDIDDNWLRYKETKVNNWLIQEFQNDIWNGEYQTVFFNNSLSHAHKKLFEKSNSQKLPSNNLRKFYEYNPNNKEIDLAMDIKKFVEQKLQTHIDYFRFDFIKDKNNNPKILEFEMVNPGFFLMYYPFEKSKIISHNFINEMLGKKVANMKKLDIELKIEGNLVSHSFFVKCPEVPIQINIVNAGESPYAKGWNNYAPFESADGINWQRTNPGTFDGNEFNFISNSKYVSWYPPYSVADLKKSNLKFHSDKLPIISIGNKNKKIILILARQHPGESIGSYFLEGLISELTKNKELLDDYNWVIYPIVNMSGLNAENHRFDANNIDLNRKWDSKIYPITEIKNSLPDKPFFVIDIHGDEVSKINTVITRAPEIFSTLFDNSDFIIVNPQSQLKKIIKSLIRDKKLSINPGKTAEKYFSDKSVPAATIELSAHINDLEKCRKLGRNFIKSFSNREK